MLACEEPCAEWSAHEPCDHLGVAQVDEIRSVSHDVRFELDGPETGLTGPRCGEIGIVGGPAVGTDLAFPDEVLERPQQVGGLVGRETGQVQQLQIEVIGSEPRQRGVQGGADIARCRVGPDELTVGLVDHVAPLRHDGQLVAYRPECLADQPLRRSCAIGVGGVLSWLISGV